MARLFRFSYTVMSMNPRDLTVRALRKAARTIAGDPPAIIYLEDEFITWLKFANAGMLELGNLHLMDYAISRLPSDAPILEIGSFCGLSANALRHFLRKHKRANHLFTCDKWEFENRQGSHIGDSAVSFQDYRTFVRDSFLRNVKMFSGSDLPFTIEVLSKEFFALWGTNQFASDVFGRPTQLGGLVSFCYIDGDHTYEGSKVDFDGCDKFLETGGFILFDDSALKYFGVSRLMPEIEQNPRYRFIARNPNHLFQKIKR
jgi:Methyltransferase domain